MLTVLFRTVLIYALLLIAMRLMGKRQIGELEISDLVTTFLVSEIASLPITEPELPLSHAIIPTIVLLAFEVFISFLLSRFPRLKGLFSVRPSTLIKDGELCQKSLSDARLSFDELFSELRRQGADDISKIKYAILEQNGKITIIQNASSKPPSAKDMKIKVSDGGMEHIVISEGFINKHSLELLKMSKKELYDILAKKNLTPKQVYLMLMDDSKKVKIFKKEEN